MKDSKIQAYIGIDPGVIGAVGFLLGEQGVVFDVPVIKSKTEKVFRRGPKKGTKKTTYHKSLDPQEMFNLINKLQGHDAVVVIERVGGHRGEQPQRAFSFGEGVGYWKMAAVACGLPLFDVRPQEWKKDYPQLELGEVSDLRESVKALRAKAKALKDKSEKERIKKEVESLNKQLKTAAKDASRRVAAELFPDIADSFKLKKDDGRAEAILIAKYAQNHKLGR